MRILCLTKYPEQGPSSRYRVHQFLPFLSSSGIDVDIQSLHDDSYLDARFAGRRAGARYLADRLLRRLLRLTAVKHYQVVFIQKEMFPYLPGLPESMLAHMGVRMVVDIDDAIHLFYERASGWKRRLLRNKIPGVMANASLVLAGNRNLARYASQFARQVVLFPTVVDTERFTPGRRSPRDVPVVGWMGTPQTVGYLQAIAPALEAVARELPFSLLVVGAPAPRLDGVSAVSRPWVEANEVADLREMDVGVMPLPDDAWSDGKCGLKLLQYMSAGVASIASPRGSATDIVAHGENAFLAGDVGEWTAHLRTLLSSPETRARIGANGRDTVVADYALSVHGPLLASYIHDVAAGREVSVGRRNAAEGAVARSSE